MISIDPRLSGPQVAGFSRAAPALSLDAQTGACPRRCPEPQSPLEPLAALAPDGTLCWPNRSEVRARDTSTYGPAGAVANWANAPGRSRRDGARSRGTGKRGVADRHDGNWDSLLEKEAMGHGRHRPNEFGNRAPPLWAT